MTGTSPIYNKNFEALFNDKENEFLNLIEAEREGVIIDTITRDISNEDFEKGFNNVVENTFVNHDADRDIRLNESGNPQLSRNEKIFDPSNQIGEKKGNSECPETNTWEGFCMHCTKYERVETVEGINRGDVIRMPRYKGLYYHYAVVKLVGDEKNQHSCILTMIHLNKIYPPIKVKPMEEIKEFNFRQEVVEKVMYKSNRYTPDDIVKRAEECAKNNSPKTYNLLQDNCEHTVNKIAQDVPFSYQVYSKTDYLKSGIPWILNCFRAIGTKIMNEPCMKNVPSVVGLLRIIYDMRELENFLKNKMVCFSCYLKDYKRLKVSLIFGLISLALTFIQLVNPEIAIEQIISVALPNVAPIFINHIMPLIQPAYFLVKEEMNTQNIQRGDVITFDYCNLPHEGVVANVKGVNSDEKKMKVRVIHFPWPGLFNTYTVTEETMYFKQNGEVCVLNFDQTDHYSAYEVVIRARSQKGKQNFNCFSNRSSHLSRFCKTGDKTLHNLPKVPVRSIHDISPGDVISFGYCGFPHEAVVIMVSEAESICADVIHYGYNGVLGTREVIEETFTFSIGDRSVYIHDYSNLNTYEPEEVVKRARSKKGEQKFNMFTNRSSHLAKWCKVKKT